VSERMYVHEPAPRIPWRRLFVVLGRWAHVFCLYGPVQGGVDCHNLDQPGTDQGTEITADALFHVQCLSYFHEKVLENKPLAGGSLLLSLASNLVVYTLQIKDTMEFQGGIPCCSDVCISSQGLRVL
jgi:hypothetical protein